MDKNKIKFDGTEAFKYFLKSFKYLIGYKDWL